MTAPRPLHGFAILAFPIVSLSGLLLVAGAGTASQPAAVDSGCGPAGTGQVVDGVPLDADQLANAQTIITVTARRITTHAATAAVIAVTTAVTESSLHNTTTQTDHDSEGLFQQRVSLYGAAVAADPVRATTAFLDHLLAVPDWPHRPPGDVAQTVQHSAYPQRYPPNVPLADALVGLFWPTATSIASTPVEPTTRPVPEPAGGDPATTTTSPAGAPSSGAVCAGGGGPGATVGPVGNVIAGTTTIPPGLVLTGSPAARTAVRFALAQLGKHYLFGAAGPDTWDCSGLTMAAWAAAGIALPHYTVTQAQHGTPIPTDLTTAVGGDLVFIPGSDGTPAAPGHVGMIVGYRDQPDGRHLLLIQAPETGVPVELTDASHWRGLIVAVRHIA
ncbi:MAG: C40 family peptidase [Jatrophihabitans sp.]|uniref:C40 family peptidase n=1 Tax=Jatrophihabitans sp. TaxID=1932789 RepID=UPI003F818480